MDIKELRIGNWVNSDGAEVQVAAINMSVIIDEGIQEGTFYGVGVSDTENVSPIPLTAEWLEQFGFEKLEMTDRERWECGDQDFELEKQGIKWAYVIRGGEDCRAESHFRGHHKYVHQLQNLYFALTGEEL